jgi:hypothetical protein
MVADACDVPAATPPTSLHERTNVSLLLWLLLAFALIMLGVWIASLSALHDISNR